MARPLPMFAPWRVRCGRGSAPPLGRGPPTDRRPEMPEHRRQLTDQQRAQRRAQDREYAHRAVEQLRSSDGWNAWLTARASFRNYSVGNQLLIAMARPTATRVAGFRAWLKLGYSVGKRPDDVPEGAWAIKIWAPCPPSRKAARALAAERREPGPEATDILQARPGFRHVISCSVRSCGRRPGSGNSWLPSRYVDRPPSQRVGGVRESRPARSSRSRSPRATAVRQAWR